MAEEAIREGHYREIIARLEGLSTRIDETRTDAREARDAATRLNERVSAQDVPAQIEHLRAAIDASTIASRSDLVNSISKVTAEMRESFATRDARLAALEAFKSKVEGATGFLGWMSKNAPWMFAMLAAAAAAVGWKDRIS